jgi:hypothetical protein
LQDVEIDSTIFRPATFIEMALKNLSNALLVGCLLVTIVLVAFLYDWRTALISLLAIPLSLLTAALVLHYQGYSINTMVIAGLVIALGAVVDDAIIDVENIMRRLRLNRATENPLPAFRVVLDASIEVRSAIVYATLIIVLVFLPVFFLDGLSGSFFRPLAVSYVLALMACLAGRRAHFDARTFVVAFAEHDKGRPPGSAGCPHSQRAIPQSACADRRSLARGRAGIIRSLRAHGCRISISRRRIPAEFQGDRFPYALGRQTRHFA